MKCKVCKTNDVKYRNGVPNMTCSVACNRLWYRQQTKKHRPLKETK